MKKWNQVSSKSNSHTLLWVKSWLFLLQYIALAFFINVWCSFVKHGLDLKIYTLEKDNFAVLVFWTIFPLK